VLAMKKQKKNKESGFALMESIVFMMAFVVLAAYAIDFFTVIHSGILGSTAARTYLFETLQHRTNVRWLRQADEGAGDSHVDFQGRHFRFHATADEDQPDTDNNGTHASGRTLTLANDDGTSMANPQLDSQANKTAKINIKTGYGICIDSACPSDTETP